MANELAPTPAQLAIPSATSMTAAHNYYDEAKSEDIELLVIHEAARLLSQATTPDMAIHGILRLMSQNEIGDLAFDLQSKLLHVLEKQLIKRVGGVKDVTVDVRIITATHKNLQKAVNEGRFRIDLFYRLNVFPIHLPPLRERSGDVRSLARHFLQLASQEFDRNTMFGSGVLERLEHYNWPGNIRQLENVVKRAVLLAQGGQINLDDIILILRHEARIGEHLEAGTSLSTAAPRTPEPTPALQEMPSQPARALQPANLRGYNWVREDEAQELLDALKQARGNKTRAAAMLGMSARQFRYRLVKLGLGDGGE